MTATSKIDALRRQLMLASLGAVGTLATRSALAQDAAARNSAIYLYKGADREARILEGAKKEGPVSIYTSLNTKDSGPITEAFEKKYGVKTLLWRSSSEKVLQRAVTEARAGRFACDVFETNGPEMEALYREKLLAEFHSPHFKDLPPGAFTKHRHYVADRFNFFTIGYNTNLIKPEEVPNTYQDLLHPRFVGKIGIEAGDTDWFAAIVKFMGEEKGLAFFRKLAEMKPQMRTGHTLMAELVSSGELPIAATIYSTTWNAWRSRVHRSSGRRCCRPSAAPTASVWQRALPIRTRRCCSPTSCSRRRGSCCSRSATVCRPAWPWTPT